MTYSRLLTPEWGPSWGVVCCTACWPARRACWPPTTPATWPGRTGCCSWRRVGRPGSGPPPSSCPASTRAWTPRPTLQQSRSQSPARLTGASRRPRYSRVVQTEGLADFLNLLYFWSVRRLKASLTPPCGIFNIIISGRRGLGIQVVLLLSCCCLVVVLLSSCRLVLLSCQSIKR